MVSIIIPTYNEAEIIAPALARLSRQRGDFEVIVADGASTDRTAAIVRSRLRSYPRGVLRVLACERPRAVQLNQAGELARGDVLLFLHADVTLPAEALEFIERVLARSEVVGGNFQSAFAGNDFWSRFFTWANRVRRRLGIYYGDSAVFVRRGVFEQLGGFKPIPIMDDYEFIRRRRSRSATRAAPR
jgi:glycosyltransferase involved in cell wall biosynthesis